MKTSQPPLVYILVLNYCSLGDTLECVSAIRSLTYPNYRLLVIDNNSPDCSGEELSKIISPHEFLQLSKNYGYAGGNNLAIKKALKRGAEYLFIVNPDIRLTTNSIDRYIDIMQSNPSISALNPIQLSPEGKTMDNFFEREMFDHNGHAPPTLPLTPNQLWDVKSLFGAALLLSRKTIETVGGFDPLYFAYWEELDICRRIKLHGGCLFVTSTEPVIHLRSYKSRGHDPFRAYLRLKGMYLFRLKNINRPFLNLVRQTFNELLRNTLLPSTNEFGWRRSTYLRAFLWLSFHIFQIRKHRKLDISGPAYL